MVCVLMTIGDGGDDIEDGDDHEDDDGHLLALWLVYW